MSGYIEYTDTSILSPVYPHAIEIQGVTYKSPHEAIQRGNDPFDTILIHVRNNRSLYDQYRNYIFSGTYSDLLNRAIQMLLVPKREPADVGRYVYLLGPDLHDKVQRLPLEFSIPIIRPVYMMSHVEGMLYRQDSTLDALEQYNVFLIEGIPLYVGVDGSFFLLRERDQSVSSAIQRLQ